MLASTSRLPPLILFVASPSLMSRGSRALSHPSGPLVRSGRSQRGQPDLLRGAPPDWLGRLPLRGGGVRQAAMSSGRDAAGVSGVQALMSGFSIEITAQGSKDIESFAKLLPAGTPVFVAALQNTAVSEVVALCKRLKADGMVPVPHLTARGVKDKAELDKTLSHFSGVGVERMLLIAGDYAVPVGEFTCALDVCKTGLFTKNGIKQVDIAGHPEGSRKIANTTAAIVEKTQWAKEAGVKMDIMTQVCFDAGVVSDWCKSLRAAGITNRVNVGVAGPAKLSTLIKFAGVLGVGPSASLLMAQPGLVAQVATMNDPATFVSSLGGNIQSSPATHGDVGVHMYSFGGFERTAEWAAEKAA